MRKRNSMMGLVAAVAISIAVPAAAHATIAPGNPTTTTVVPTPSKQQKKVRGGVGFAYTTYTAHVPSGPGTLTPAANVVVDFDKDFAFDGGDLDQCNASQLAGTTTEAAKAICGDAEVGAGFATTCTAAQECVNGPATVTAFNGRPSGGSLGLLLHTRIGGIVNNTLVLDGTLINSPLGSPYGKRLNVIIQDSTPTGRQLETFFVDISKKVSEKRKVKNKKTGKKRTVKSFYISAKCSGDKVWQFSSTNVHYRGPTTSDIAEVPCKQKKSKKKKK